MQEAGAIVRTQVGHSVTVQFRLAENSTREETYKLTEAKHDPKEGLLSKDSIWGRLLLKRRLNETVTLPAPEDNELYGKIVSIL